MRTTPPLVLRLPRDGHRAHRSTAVPFLFFHFLAPAPAPARRQREVCRLPSRGAAALPPAAPATGSFRPPSPPASSVPTRHLPAHKSPTADTAASDRSISTPARAPRGPDPQHHAGSDDSALRLARSVRSTHRLVSVEPDGSLGIAPARTPEFPKRLRPEVSALHRSPDKRPASAGTSVLRAAGAPARAAALVSPRRLQRAQPLPVCAKQRCSPLASPATRPAAIPVARSDDLASPTCDRTASAAAWRSAASSARSRGRAIVAVRLSTAVVHAARR